MYFQLAMMMGSAIGSRRAQKKRSIGASGSMGDNAAAGFSMASKLNQIRTQHAQNQAKENEMRQQSLQSQNFVRKHDNFLDENQYY
jgi:hypothetical protein